MKAIGYNQPLYILPFDHRGSFQTILFGWKRDPTSAQTAAIMAVKRVIYDGFKVAVAAGVPLQKAGILVDEQFGAAILRDAKANNFKTACPAEKRGQVEFDFEYGDAFAKHIELFQPTFCKVLVRYNPEGDFNLNRRQLLRLKQLSDYLHGQSQSRFMVELVVPAEQSQLDRFNGDKQAYNLKLRPQLMLLTIHQLQNCGIEPDVWKIEGLDRRGDCEQIAAAARRNGREQVGCMALGRGVNDQKVYSWLTTAARVDGFIGFAVERIDFWEPLINFTKMKIGRESAVWEIARHFHRLAGIFEKFVPDRPNHEKQIQNTVGHDWTGPFGHENNLVAFQERGSLRGI